jgi:hypothetical protein
MSNSTAVLVVIWIYWYLIISRMNFVDGNISHQTSVFLLDFDEIAYLNYVYLYLTKRQALLQTKICRKIPKKIIT